MALPHPIPYFASGCHHMSQRANACHCPEVTRELNRFSHTTSPRTKARTPQSAQAVMCTLSVWREAAEEPLPTAGCGAVQSSPSPPAAQGVGRQVCAEGSPPALPAALVCRRHSRGPPLCPGGPREPSSIAWVPQSCGSALLLGLVFCGCRQDLDLNAHFHLLCVQKRQASQQKRCMQQHQKNEGTVC